MEGMANGQFTKGVTPPTHRKRQRDAASCANARAGRGRVVVVEEQSLPLAPREVDGTLPHSATLSGCFMSVCLSGDRCVCVSSSVSVVCVSVSSSVSVSLSVSVSACFALCCAQCRLILLGVVPRARDPAGGALRTTGLRQRSLAQVAGESTPCTCC